jgi:3-mercaptopyruvate sulfurtransferase SseA
MEVLIVDNSYPTDKLSAMMKKNRKEGEVQALYTPRWLHEQLTDDNLLVVDCRFAPNNPALGEEQYRHEQGALYLHLECDLSDKKSTHAGHPDVKLYSGSWSGWCSYDLPVAAGPATAGEVTQ